MTNDCTIPNIDGGPDHLICGRQITVAPLHMSASSSVLGLLVYQIKCLITEVVMYIYVQWLSPSI